MSSPAGKLLNEYMCSVIQDLRIERGIHLVEMAERTGAFLLVPTTAWRRDFGLSLET